MAWSEAITVAPAAAEPISLADVKEFVSIDADVDEFDALLTGFIAAARAHAEAITGTRLAEQTILLQADHWSDLLRLPIGPVISVASLRYEDRDGVDQLVDPAVYELIGVGLTQGVRTAAGQGWPNDVRSASGSIQVELSVGYESLPKTLWTALLLMVSDMFAFRESGVVGTVSAEVRSSVRVMDLLGHHRIWL